MKRKVKKKECEINEMLKIKDSGFASRILEIISEENEEVRKRIIELFQELKVENNMNEIEKVADDIYECLDKIDVEILWDHSGASRYGYQEPYEVAYEMIETEIEPYIDELKEYIKTSEKENAIKYFIAMGKGLYKFDKEGKSEFQKWSEDMSLELYKTIYDSNIKSELADNEKQEIANILRENCPRWKIEQII